MKISLRSTCINFLLTLLILMGVACAAVSPEDSDDAPSDISTTSGSEQQSIPVKTAVPTEVDYEPVVGCLRADYPDWETSLYVLPFPVGETHKVRLSNCSGSFHGADSNDKFAFDFMMGPGTLITAARAGTVVYVVENGKGREVNNMVVVDHGDDTFAEYMHLVQDGALVEEGDVVKQGDDIGLSGATGMAGYPHLHFIVVQDSWHWPYEGVPVTFRNTSPNPHGLASNTIYTAVSYR